MSTLHIRKICVSNTDQNMRAAQSLALEKASRVPGRTGCLDGWPHAIQYQVILTVLEIIDSHPLPFFTHMVFLIRRELQYRPRSFAPRFEGPLDVHLHVRYTNLGLLPSYAWSRAAPTARAGAMLLQHIGASLCL